MDGVTGILCESVDDAVAKVPQLAALDRKACRARVEECFTVERMIDRYAGAYASAIEQKLPPQPTPDELRWREHDWWDRPMAFTDIPPKPKAQPLLGRR